MANKTISLSNPDQIEELIIEPHTILDDDGNQLVAKPLGGTLNLSIFKNATTIDCSNNAISDVGLLPESIEFFDCENNNVSGLNQSFDVPETIKDLNFKNNDLGSIDIDKILQRTLENNINGIIGDGNYRKLDLEGNDPPSLVGVAYKEELELLNWEINTEPFVGDRTFTLSNVPTPPLLAYSLRNLFDPSANVVRVRRSYDSAESDFTGSDIESGVMTEWVRYADLPLDIQIVDDFSSPPPYTRTGGVIQPRVAYGLRNLGTGANQWTYGGDTLEYESDFSAGVDGWGVNNVTHTANIDDIGGRDDCLRVTPNTVLNQHYIGLPSTFITGSSYTVSFDFYIPSSNTDLDGIDSREGAGSGSLIVDEPTPALDTWVSASGTHTGDGTSELRIRPLSGGNQNFSFNGTDVFYVRNVKVYKSLGDTELLPSGKYIAQVRRNLDNTIKSFTADEITDGTLETFVKAENLVYESDFSANTNGWGGNHWGVITTANQDNILDRDDCLKCELSKFNSHDHAVVKGVSNLPQAKVRYQVDVYVPSSNTIVDGIRLQSNGGSGGENFKNLKGNAWHTLSTNLNLRGANQIRVIALSGDKTWYPGNDTDLFYIRNVKVFSVAENALPLDETASAAYSIDNYKESGTDVTTSGDTGGDNTGKYVIQVQRSFDNEIRSFTANEVDDGTMENWVKVTYDASLSPLDQATGAAAAYSLRNLSSSYTNYVVRVRRNIDGEEENFAAPGVTDGTLESFVKGEEVIYESDFSAGTDGWSAMHATATTEVDPIDAGNVLKITVDTSSKPKWIQLYQSVVGNRYTIQAEVYVPSGNLDVDGVSLMDGAGGMRTQYPNIQTDEWVQVTTSGVASLRTLNIRPMKGTTSTDIVGFLGNGTDTLYVRNVKIISYAENELPLDQATGAAAAYSLRNLSSSYTGDVVEVRRSSDSAVQSFTASEVANGTLESFVNTNVNNVLPLDQATGAAAAYSLRNLSSSYTGDVVEVRRSSDSAVQSFTASEVANGTLESWVNTSFTFDDKLPLDQATGAKAAYSLRNLSSSYSGAVVKVRRPGNNAFADFTANQVANGAIENWLKSTFYVVTPTLNNGDFETAGYGGFDFWTETAFGSSTITRDTTEFYSGTASCRFDLDSAASAAKITTSGLLRFPAGSTMTYSIWAKGTSGAQLMVGTSSNDLLNDKLRLTTEWQEYTGTVNSADVDSLIQIKRYFTANGTIWIDNVTFKINEGKEAFVHTWYDQSGNGNHATQTDPTKQPKIVENGTLIADGIKFDGTDDQQLESPSINFGDNPNTVFTLVKQNTDISTNTYFLQLGNWANLMYYGGTSKQRLIYSGNSVFGGIASSNQELWSAFFDNPNDAATLYVNGTQEGSGNMGTNVVGTSTIKIGTNGSSISLNGWFKEIIIYNSDQSTKRRAIEENIANHYNIGLPDTDTAYDAYIRTWYDQSGNTNDATQTDPTKQPKIVEGGTLNSDGIYFDGTNNELNSASIDFGGNPNTIFTLVKSNGASKATYVTLGNIRNLIAQGTYGHRGIFAGRNLIGSPTSSDLELWSTVFDTPNGVGTLHANGTQDISGNVGTRVVGTQTIRIGANNGSNPLNGWFKELIIYNSDQSTKRGAIEENIANHYGISLAFSRDAFVRTWYDQSGSGNHAVQTTPANQPKIVEGGNLLEDGVDFDGTNDYLEGVSFSLSQALTILSVSSHSLQDAVGVIVNISNSYTEGSKLNDYYRADNGFAINSGLTVTTAPSFLYSQGANYIKTSLFNGSSSEIFVNGTSRVTGDAGSNNLSGNLYIGGTNPYSLNGTIQELIIYNSDQSTKRRAIEENIANHYDISLAAFSRDGTVSTWYDQSGNTNDATQTDPTKQPKIIQNGEYLGELHFDGSNDYLSNSDIGAYQSSDGVGFFCAYSKDAVSTSDSFGGTNPQYLLQLRNTNLSNTTFAARVLGGKLNVVRANEATNNFLTTTSDAHTIGKSLVLSSVTGTQAVNLFENGSELSLQTNESGLSYDSATTNLIIGSEDAGRRFLDGGIKEMIIYKTDQTNNRKLIEKNILNYYKIPHTSFTSFWDGTIRTWYDQTGKENHNIETDVKKQLKIVDDGITNQSITTTAGNTASVAYSLRSLGTNQWTSKKETIVYQSNFEVQDGWSWNIGGVATPTNDTIAGYNDWLKFISDSSDDEHLLANHIMTIGEKYRLTFEFFIPKSNQKINGIQFRDNHRIYGTFNNLEKGKLHKISMPMAHGCYSTPVKLRGMYNGHANFVGVEGDSMYIRNVELRKFNGETEELNPDRYVVQIRRESDGMVKSFTADNLKENIEAFCGEADIDDTRPAIPSNRYLKDLDVTTEIIDRRSSVKFTLNGTTDSRYFHLTKLGIGKYKFTGSIHVKYKDKESAGWTSPISFYMADSTLSRPLYDESNGTTGTTYTWTDDDPLIIESTRYASIFLYTHGTGNDLRSVPNAEITVTNFAIQQIHTDAYVTAWYDQSGNENHAEQIDTAQQPKIVDAGNLVKDSNNEPQIGFDGTQYLNKPEFTQGILTKPISSFTVFERNGGVYVHDSYNSHKRFALEAYSHITRLYNGGTLDTPTTIGKGDKSLVNMRSDGANSYIAINGAAPYSDENHTGNHDMSGIVIGAAHNRRDGARLNGFIQEIIIYDSDQFTKRRIIEENIANHYDIALPALSRDGTVSTWYDQSGNNIHLTPAQPEHEPKIVSDGVIVRDRNGKIALNGNKARLNFPATTDFFSSDGSQSLFMVYDFADQKDVSTDNGSNNDIVNLRADTGVQKLKVRVAKPSGEIEVLTNNDDSNMYTYNNSDTITSQQITYTFDGSTSNASLDKSTLVQINGITQNTDRDIGSPTSSVRSWIFDNAETVDTYISEFIYYGFDTIDYADYEFIEDAVKPSSTGYVETWYDQSGNNHDVSQSFADSQPWIVKDGEYIGHIQFDSVQGTTLVNSDIGPFQISSGIGFFCNYIVNSTTSEGEPSYGGTLVNIYDNVDIFSAHLYIDDPYGPRNVKPQIFRRDLNDTKTLITRSKDIITEDKFNLFSAVGESELTLFNNTAKLDLERDDISTSATTTAGELSIGSTRGLGSFIDGGINEIILYQENINPTLRRFIETDIILHHNI